MDKNALIKQTDTIPIIDPEGNIIDNVRLPEKIVPVITKRGGFADSGVFYKGAGTIYTCHFDNKRSEGMTVISETGILYEKYKLCNTRLCGKYGIFMFPHQPIFTDYEGGCGPKEANLVKMQEKFKQSAIKEIVDVIPTGIENHNIYAYCLKNRNGTLHDIGELMEYILTNHFCTAWDKNLWADLYGLKYVRDVGDWFESEELSNRLGTIFALMHSLYKTDVYTYCELLKELLNVYNCDRHFVIYYSSLLVQKYCPDIFNDSGVDLENVTPELFGELLKIMFQGKACCHLENDEKWGWVRERNLSRVDSYVTKMRRTLSYL